MPRKDNRNNPLGIRIRPFSIPKSISSVSFFARLFQACEERLRNGFAFPLPPAWDVRLWWINPRSRGATRHWRWDDFIEAINESRDGFVEIVKQIVGRAWSREKAKAELRRKLRTKRPKVPRRKKR